MNQSEIEALLSAGKRVGASDDWFYVWLVKKVAPAIFNQSKRVENYRIFSDLEGFLQVLVNIFKVFCLFVTKKLETQKSFATSDCDETFWCPLDAPSLYRSF